jgi:hypothetical protein
LEGLIWQYLNAKSADIAEKHIGRIANSFAGILRVATILIKKLKLPPNGVHFVRLVNPNDR